MTTTRFPTLRRSERRVLVVTTAYTAAAGLWFAARGDHEFLIYMVQMVAAIGVLAATARRMDYPAAFLWALSLWGLAHMAGGGVPVGDGRLYGLVLLPLAAYGDATILSYDQVAHAYGFGVTAWGLWIVLLRSHPALRGTRTIYAFAFLGALGLGALCETGELLAVLVAPETNVGGYFNNAFDLVFNAIGAFVALHLVWRIERAAAARPAAARGPVGRRRGEA